MAKIITPQMIADKMGKSVKDVIFQLQTLGADIRDAQEVLEPEVIQALITGKRLTTRTRSVIMRESKPAQNAPNPIPATRKVASPAPPTVSKSPEQRVDTPLSPQATLPRPDIDSYRPSMGELLWSLRQMMEADRRQASNEVFIVHGHDNIRHEVAGFLTSLSLEPIMLDERPNRGQTIIEKLEEHAYTSFAVVLLTPDDEGRKKGSDPLQMRPRQNVVLELGYFLARLGRHKVCALYVPGVELPSDVHGLLYVQLDQSGGWKYKLQKELGAAGIPMRLPS